MSSAFPFGLPGSTALYLVLYVVTLLLHVVFMSYVLAGSGYMAVWAVRKQFADEPGRDPVAGTLRDWLPFALGMAITAGVAPLLFIQILYKEQFYTANLLLFHRWMAIVPVLMVGFYLLYLAKSKRIESWPVWARTVVAGGAFFCFLFVAFAFAENHMLAMQDQSQWVQFYVDQRIVFMNDHTPLRVALWLSGALSVFAVIMGWQRRQDESQVRTLGIIALVGTAAAVGFGALYWNILAEPARSALTGAFALPYAVALVLGLIGQCVAWTWQLKLGRFHKPALVLASIASGTAILGTIVLREALRLQRLGSDQLFALHERTASAGGMPLFIVFLIANGALITWCVVLTRRGLKQ